MRNSSLSSRSMVNIRVKRTILSSNLFQTCTSHLFFLICQFFKVIFNTPAAVKEVVNLTSLIHQLHLLSPAQIQPTAPIKCTHIYIHVQIIPGHISKLGLIAARTSLNGKRLSLLCTINW